MSREERRDNKTTRERELRRLNREIVKRGGPGWGRWNMKEDISFTWEEYPAPVFVGYVKDLVPAAKYANDPLVRVLSERYTHSAFSRDKRFLKKHWKTKKLVDVVPEVKQVWTRDPLELGVPEILIPYFECTGKQFDRYSQKEMWIFSPMVKYFEIKKSKLYHTHHRILNGEYLRESDDLEERFEQLGGYRKFDKLIGVHHHDYDDMVFNYKVMRKDLYTH